MEGILFFALAMMMAPSGREPLRKSPAQLKAEFEAARTDAEPWIAAGNRALEAEVARP
jgi:hypothetical protein